MMVIQPGCETGKTMRHVMITCDELSVQIAK